MKKTNLLFVKSKRILLAIALANTCVCGEISAINEDTPGLSFEMGFPESFTDDQLGVWKRYYGFYGPEDYGTSQTVYEFSNGLYYTKPVCNVSNLFFSTKRTTGSMGDEDRDGWVQYGKAKYDSVEFCNQDSYDLANRCLKIKSAYSYMVYGLSGNGLDTITFLPGDTVPLPLYIDYNDTTHETTASAKYVFPSEKVKFPQGSFDIIDKRELDPMIQKNCCADYPFYTMPDSKCLEPGQKVVRIGSTDYTEMLYNASMPFGYERRAMAERMVYSFEVKENSTLLGCQHAAFLEDVPAQYSSRQDDFHEGDKRPSGLLSVTIKDAKGNAIHPLCGLFDLNTDNGDEQFTRIENKCSWSGSRSSYKDWTNYVYDLREHIGEIVTIEVWVHDCLLELPVCDNCKTVHPNNDYFVDEDGTTRIPKCENQRVRLNSGGYPYAITSGCGKKNAKCRLVPMAGGHRAYCYFTAFTKKLEMVVDSSSASDTITITAPMGFSRYEWKTGTAPFVSEDGKSNVAKLLRSDIQENTDYSCVMFGDDENCTKIIGTVQLFKDGSGVVDELGERVVSYPNPVKDALIVKGYANLPYTIFSMRGEAVSQGLMAGEKIDLSSLTTGGYWLKISREDGKTDYLKVIKE